MGGVGALFGADMFASAEGSKPDRVVGDIGGIRHTTGRRPSSRRESGIKVDLLDWRLDVLVGATVAERRAAWEEPAPCCPTGR